jgi:hypothetical protein
VVVHDIEVHDVGAGGEHVIDFLAEPGEVGGKNAGGDPEGLGHGELPKVDASILPAARRGGFRKCDDGYKQIAVPPAPTYTESGQLACGHHAVE